MTSPRPAALECPACRAAMTPLSLPAHYGATVVIDHCEACALFWFDPMETVSLSKAGLLQVFQLIGDGAVRDRNLPEHAPCPRCGQGLHAVFDITRFGRTRHYRCTDGHGHAVTHLQFLAEKGLLRTPHAQELQATAARPIQTPCPSCGAPLDALTDGRCGYCGAAVTVMDIDRVLQTLAVHDHSAPETPPLSEPERTALALIQQWAERQR